MKTVYIPRKTIEYGYLPPEEVTADQYVLGVLSALPKEVLQPDGQWDNFLPDYEPQFENFETAGCTIWGTQNCVETIIKRKFNRKVNYAERFNYILTPVTFPGSTPHIVGENFRKVGLIENSKLPMTATFEEFISPNPMPSDLLNLGREWLRKYSFFHEWVFTSGSIGEKQKKLMEALKYSSLGVSVYAWARGDDDLYVKLGDDNHWCELFGYIEGKYWKCFDSYDHSIKHLEWDFDFGCAKRYYIRENLPGEYIPDQSEPWYKRIINFFISLIK